MYTDPSQESDLVELSRAITKALLKSNEVIKLLDELKKDNRLQPNTMLAFLLKTDALLDIYSKENETMQSNKQTNFGKRKLLSSGKDKAEFIDGRRLTENEVVFEKYYSEKFNEKEWLRGLGLRL